MCEWDLGDDGVMIARMNVYMLRGLHDCCGYGPTAVYMDPEGATTGNTAVPYGLRCPWLTIDNK